MCCIIECDKKAGWVIEMYPYGPDDYTTACTEHVGELLTDALIHVVYRVEKE